MSQPDYVQRIVQLRVWAENFHDVLKLRIAVENRLGAGNLDPLVLDQQKDAVRESEKVARRILRNAYRDVVPNSIREWQQETVGIGEHTLALLLAQVYHPRLAFPFRWEGEGEDRTLVPEAPYERTLSQLWAYCGHGDPNRRRKKGMAAEDAFKSGNVKAKTALRLIAEGCMKKVTSPYRAVYDDARVHYLDRDWTLLHQHNAALRKVGKEILRELWEVSADDPIVHQIRPETHAITFPPQGQSRSAGFRAAPSRQTTGPAPRKGPSPIRSLEGAQLPPSAVH